MLNIPTNRRAALAVWHLTDSALPTGGFAHSAGLETYIQADLVNSPESFGAWLDGYLRQASYNEALAVRFAVELQESDLPDAVKEVQLAELDQLCHACQTPKQVRDSMNSMGKRWTRVSAIVAPDDHLVEVYRDGVQKRTMHGNPGLAAGLVLGALGVPAEEAVAAYLMQMANSITQNAIRAIPLGQDAGQRILVGAYDSIDHAAGLTMARDVTEFGIVPPRLEVAQMQHEALLSRMFMS